MVDEETTKDSTAAAAQHEPPQIADEPESKRNKHEWLAFHGKKQTRVGADFQVTALPTPGESAVLHDAEEESSPETAGEGPEEGNGDDTAEQTTNNATEIPAEDAPDTNDQVEEDQDSA